MYKQYGEQREREEHEKGNHDFVYHNPASTDKIKSWMKALRHTIGVAQKQKRPATHWYYPLKVDSVKKTHIQWDLTTVDRRGFFMSAKKGQKHIRYSDELKLEAARLIIDGNWSQYQVQAKFAIRSRTQIMEWVKKYKAGKLLEDHRGKWKKKHFNSLEEENAYLKAQVEYLKKLNPNLHGEGSWINKNDSD
jgi:transposase